MCGAGGIVFKGFGCRGRGSLLNDLELIFTRILDFPSRFFTKLRTERKFGRAGCEVRRNSNFAVFRNSRGSRRFQGSRLCARVVVPTVPELPL